MLEVKLLLLLFCANSAPVLARYIFGNRWDYPVDGGWMLADGNPLFGSSKTWRGLLAALLLTAVAALIMGLSLGFGLLFGFCAMLGDLLSSYIKRRLGKPPSAQALLLDQLPEAVLPLGVGSWLLGYSWKAVIGIALVFMLIELMASPLLFRFGLRKKPY